MTPNEEQDPRWSLWVWLLFLVIPCSISYTKIVGGVHLDIFFASVFPLVFLWVVLKHQKIKPLIFIIFLIAVSIYVTPRLNGFQAFSLPTGTPVVCLFLLYIFHHDISQQTPSERFYSLLSFNKSPFKFIGALILLFCSFATYFESPIGRIQISYSGYMLVIYLSFFCGFWRTPSRGISYFFSVCAIAFLFWLIKFPNLLGELAIASEPSNSETLNIGYHVALGKFSASSILLMLGSYCIGRSLSTHHGFHNSEESGIMLYSIYKLAKKYDINLFKHLSLLGVLFCFILILTSSADIHFALLDVNEIGKEEIFSRITFTHNWYHFYVGCLGFIVITGGGGVMFVILLVILIGQIGVFLDWSAQFSLLGLNTSVVAKATWPVTQQWISKLIETLLLSVVALEARAILGVENSRAEAVTELKAE